MKRLLVITFILVCGMTFSDCFAKKPKKVVNEIEDSLRNERSDISRYEETKDDKSARMELEKKMAELEREMDRPVLPPTLEETEFSCQEEAKSTEEYYAAFGVSHEQRDPNQAFQDAIRNAKMDLAQQLGGDGVALDYVETICRKLTRTKVGTYIAYVAIRMQKTIKTDKADSPLE